MATTERPIIGIFDEPSMADRAITELESAGFSSDQIYHSAFTPSSSGGIFGGIRRLFTHDDTTADDTNVVRDLTSMGVSDDEARYYESEYQAGHTVVAVRAGGREPEVMVILQTNAAHNYAMAQRATQTGSATTATADTVDRVDTVDTVDTTPTGGPTTPVSPTRTADSVDTTRTVDERANRPTDYQ